MAIVNSEFDDQYVTYEIWSDKNYFGGRFVGLNGKWSFKEITVTKVNLEP